VSLPRRALALALVLGGALVGSLVPSTIVSAEPLAQVEDDAHPVLLIGLTGVRWDDVHLLPTPALWDISRRGAVGAVSTRTARASGCPADGWLAVSAGTRLADREVFDGTCRGLAEPDDGEQTPGWPDYVVAAEEQSYGATPGMLGQLLTDAGVTTTGIGPGAAIALSDEAGQPVGTHVRRPTRDVDLQRAVHDALAASQLVVVDAGSVRDAGHMVRARSDSTEELTPTPGELEGIIALQPSGDEPPEGSEAIIQPNHAEQIREVDERVEAALRAARGTDATVLVVSLADSGRTDLQVAVASGPAPDGGTYAENLLTSGSTRQDGVIQTTDVTSTLVALLGLKASDVSDSAPIVPVSGPATGTERAALLDDISTEAHQVTRLSGSYLTRLVLAQAVLFIIAALMLTRANRLQRVPVRRALQVVEVAALALGSAPIASFLVGAVPWWRAASPVTGFWVALFWWMAIITTIALFGPWRRSPLGPAAFVSGVTAVVLVVDALTGSSLVIDSPMGSHRLMAARFYGMSNQGFALLAAGGLILATAIAHSLVERGRRGWAIASVVTIGVVVTVVDGAPGLGSDFGGPPGLILGFAVLATAVAGRRVNWRALLLLAFAGAVVVMGFAWFDWLREPADRTHLGRFFATVVDGGVWEVIVRKAAVHLRVLTLWRYLVLAIGGGVVTALVLRGPHARGRLRGRGPLAGLADVVPLLNPCVTSVGITLGVGFLINDSGIIVPATGIAVAVPCLLAAAAHRRLTESDEAAVAGLATSTTPSGPVAPSADESGPVARSADETTDETMDEPARKRVDEPTSAG
jgi:hypothetical protein